MDSEHKSLYQLITESYGVNTTQYVNPITDEAATSATRMFKLNPMRVSMLMVNLGANSIFVHTHSDVSSDKGIYLSPNGGSLSLNWESDFELVGQEFWALATTAAVKVYCLEVVSL